MSKWEKTDLRLTPDGDLVIEAGDFSVVTKDEFIEQSIRNRVRTSDPEWWDPIIQDIGANLEDLRGKPNSPETAAEGVDMIGLAVTRDGLIDIDDVFIDVVPYDRETITFFLFINSPYRGEPIGFEIRMNLTAGVEMRRV